MDSKHKFVNNIIQKYGYPHWDNSLSFNNSNGYQTHFIPLTDSNNTVNRLLLAYQNGINGYTFKIINKNDPQSKLPEHGNKEASIFTKQSLKGIFKTAEEKLLTQSNNSSLSTIDRNKVKALFWSVSYSCWYYTWTESDGSFGISNTQCSYSFDFTAEVVRIIQFDEPIFGGAGSGSSGNTTNNFKIWNSIINPCLRDLVNKIINNPNRLSTPLNTPTYTDLLTGRFYDIFGGRNYFVDRNIVFAESAAFDNEAKYRGAANYYFQTSPDTIYLNPSIIGADASQEYIASIILHEMAHSVIAYTGQSIYLTQHMEMAANYVDLISKSLKLIFPTLEIEAANSMALQGLGKEIGNSSYFETLIAKYGFNRIPNNDKNWAYDKDFYITGIKGTKQCK